MYCENKFEKVTTIIAWIALIVLILTWTGTLEWIAYVSYEYDIPIIPTLTSPWYPDL